ncbi:FliC/FljB family flagellin [Serratia sp. Lou2A]|jgi:Flagellin and related hook-associated proteins|uniref:Flagellin n=2 Tax=Serratia TaxID=613 RepID=A0A1C3HFA5_SERMA|nr:MULTISPECIES: FliC/FljB family flagellin [Serratia]MDI6933115.1 FliC/FljB family flagellin [Serratia sp. Se-PFBMAAmG]MCC7584753.1 FliC/FljB family flagellin [Serratia sp. Lou2A]MCC7661182.1 FliC/FljB family flagellin [Serratia sp. Pon4B]MDI6974071.1 FliC/FljB family flagellin [Serratia sp. Se-RSBMAAmG]MDI9262797.1 FliC/FljB family flagellin [Serratia sp. PF2-63]
MAQVINTNSLSLMAQNNLNKSQSSLGTAIERLSSGLRINSAKDDAAGQAISNRFTANIKGLTQASRNANDGISLAQTTEGALNEVNDNLQNIRRLTVQAQNGSNSSSDLKSIQDEITERMSEINRISAQTDFNGVKVLSSDQKLTIQVGANDGETIDINLQKIDSTKLGLDGFDVTTKGPTAGSAIATGAHIKAATGEDVVYDAATAKSGLADGKALISGKGADGKDAMFVETTDKTTGAKTYAAASVDKDGKVTEGTAVTMKNPLDTLDKALAQVDGLRSSLGAVQNRFDSVINNLNSTVNNLSASQSRIQDADYATEVSNMSRANILQQAGTSVLAQANQSTQNVLSLLR